MKTRKPAKLSGPLAALKRAHDRKLKARAASTAGMGMTSRLVDDAPKVAPKRITLTGMMGAGKTLSSPGFRKQRKGLVYQFDLVGSTNTDPWRFLEPANNAMMEEIRKGMNPDA